MHKRDLLKIRPFVTVATRPVAPRRDYVWVNDEWVVRNGAYVNVPGHWQHHVVAFFGFQVIGQQKEEVIIGYLVIGEDNIKLLIED